MITAGWVGLYLQNLFGGAVSQNVSHATTLVAGLGSCVGTVLDDVTDLEKPKLISSKMPESKTW